MAKMDSNEIEEEYKSISADLTSFENALIEQLDKLFKDIKLGFPIQHRVKTLNSIKEKHESKRYTIKKSIQELQDLVGFRIILLFKRDVASVIKLLEENFDIVNSYDTSDKLSHDQFGYSSKHLTLKIKKEWLNVPTFRGFENYTAEIQVRTLSQHNWAETSNALQYKNETNVPKEILRSIGRLSALLETIDLELERTLSEREVYISQINLNESNELNIETLKIVLNNCLPENLERDSENYSGLMRLLAFFEITKVDELIKVIQHNVQFPDNKNTSKVRFRVGKADSWKSNEMVVITNVSSLIVLMLLYSDHKKWDEYVKYSEANSFIF
ncbi:RelA/SpoT domain-containing protein [Chryseobacterium culicis]|uniref:(P)ppGpp synthetase n=1 Tax=Chryseobacterium culicis TaxID=680127 RepID=A0A2S9CXA1_CHRCI|nr:RelA/SpoT domain-containing protein [Chryseobacterium culicis]PRB85143.1 (p)ppGpp synthetase [Chryseobacterium culicis]PRB91134.1 (p)ppGpp synthetase [Chryseobacterium culicis]